MSWVPLDVIGQAYVDWIVTPDPLPFLVNVVHPRPTTWNAVLKAVGEVVETKMTTVPLNDWIGQLEERSPNATLEDLARYVSFFSPLYPVKLTCIVITARAQDIRFLPVGSSRC